MPDIDALLNAIESAESESYGSASEGQDGNLSDQRAAALDLYFGRNTFPAPEGQSQVVSRDVFDTVETILPSLVRIFAGTDEVVQLQPIGPNDEEQAEQESMYLNHVVTQKNQWEQVFHDWAWDALVTNNAYCLAFWDDSKEVEYETYRDQTEAGLAMILEDGVDVLEHAEKPDEEANEQAAQAYQQAMQQYQQMVMAAEQQAMQTGQMPELPPPPPQPQPQFLHDIKVRRTKERGQVRLRVLPPERCVVHQRTPDYTLADCDFFEFWEEMPISNLRAMGFDVADDIASDETGGSESEEDEARDRYNEDRTRSEAWEPAMRPVKAKMVWIRHDYDGDGIAEMQFCLVVGRTVLYREECTRIPVGSFVAVPVPHRHIGMSLADVLSEIQETKTIFLRQGIDNLMHANNVGMFINDGKINVDDAMTNRPGRVVRGVVGENAVFGQDIAPIVTPNVFPNAVQGMEYLDSVKQGRTGVNNYFAGTDENALNKTASGVSQLMGAAAQRVEQIARMMAPSVEYLFACAHELILKHGHKTEVVKLKGKWVEVDPSGWRKKRDLKIAVGLGSGSRDAMLAHLQMILGNQMSIAMPLGITDPPLIHNTLTEMTKAAGFPSGAQFWKEPQPPQPPPPPPEVIAEQMRQQFEAQQAEMDRRLEAAKTQANNETKEYVAELQAQTQQIIAAFKGWIEQQQQTMQAQLDERRSAEESMRKDLEFVSRQADRQPVSVNVGREEANEELAKMAEAFSQQMADLAARIDGSRTVGIQRIKGPDGKLAGGRVIRADGSSQDIPIQ